MVPGEAAMGKTIFTCVCNGKNCRTRRPISIKIYTNHPCMKGIQVSTNKGPGPIQREDNHKNAKLG
jgi:hypothetical protein